jgi:hypothetical protein
MVFPSFSRRPDGVVVKQVEPVRIATDPNYRREYRWHVPDEEPKVPTSGEVTPDDVALHDLVPAEPEPVPATATPITPLPVAPEETGYTASGVPTFDYAREKIETRYGTAIGAHELASETPERRTVEEQYEARQKAAAERLAQIRESIHGDAPDNT